MSLDIPAAETAVPRGRLHGPASPKVWARAWLANERDGTLAEVALECVDAASCVNLIVKLHDPRIPENACIRTESAPFVTEHVVIIKLPNHVTH